MEQVPAQRAEYHRVVARHFLTGEEITSDELERLLDRAIEMKADRLAVEGRSRAARSR